MIISDRYSFLYVANLRTASTSMHSALKPLASINLDATSGGKHASLVDIYQMYGRARVAPLFKWAVIRRPKDYLRSMYEFHQAPAFDGKPHSTKGKTFAEFYESESHGWMRVPQSSRFLDPEGDFGLDFLVTMDRLHEGFAYLKFRLGLPNVLLPRLNRSRSSSRRPIAQELAAQIRADYAVDYECIERYANKERTPHGFVPVLEPFAGAPAATGPSGG